MHWKVIRVTEVHTGKDNHVRVTTLESESHYKESKTGKMKKILRENTRPVVKLAKITHGIKH